MKHYLWYIEESGYEKIIKKSQNLTDIQNAMFTEVGKMILEYNYVLESSSSSIYGIFDATLSKHYDSGTKYVTIHIQKNAE